MVSLGRRQRERPPYLSRLTSNTSPNISSNLSIYSSASENLYIVGATPSPVASANQPAAQRGPPRIGRDRKKNRAFYPSISRAIIFNVYIVALALSFCTLLSPTHARWSLCLNSSASSSKPFFRDRYSTQRTTTKRRGCGTVLQRR